VFCVHPVYIYCVCVCVCVCVWWGGEGLGVLVLHVALPIGVRGQGDAQTPVLAGFGKGFDRPHSLLVLFSFVGLVQGY
jgi:predicted secreted protein